MVRRLWAAIAAALCVVSFSTPASAARFYVDRSLGSVADRGAITSPGQVQLLVEFQTNGVRNERGTKEARKMVMAELAKLPYLPSVTEKPVTSGALLTVKINNVFSEADRKKAMKAAFASGFTFGASDTVVRDDYKVTVTLVPATGAPAMTSEVAHALVTTLGKGSNPSFGTEYKKATEAVSALIGQALDHGLNNIAHQGGA